MVRALRVGVPSGMSAGAVMAVWSMVAMWIVGSGFWTPLNLIAPRSTGPRRLMAPQVVEREAAMDHPLAHKVASFH